MSDDDRKKRKSIEKDGVIYTPSGKTPPKGKTPPRPTSGPYRPKRGPNKRPTQSSQIGPYLAVTILVGVIVCVVAFALAFNTLTGSLFTKNPPVDEQGSLTTIATNTTEHTSETTTGTGIANTDESVASVLSITPSASVLSLYEIDNAKEIILTVDANTKLKDKYGGMMLLQEYAVGDIVDIVYDPDTKRIENMKISSKSFTFHEIVGLDIIAADRVMMYGTDRFTFNEHVICKYMDKDYALGLVDKVDLVSIHGYNDQVYRLEVVKGHGYLQIEEKLDIVGPVLEMDLDYREKLESFDTIPVLEGEHKLVIKGDNIELFKKTINIQKDETYKLDLPVTYTSGFLHVAIEEEGYLATIDGIAMDLSVPILLPYGSYELKVSKEGSSDFVQKVIIEAANEYVTVVMQKIISVATINVSTIPTGANVYLDNVFIGASPVTTTAEFGAHTLTIYKDGYVDLTIPLIVESAIYEPIIELQLITSTFP